MYDVFAEECLSKLPELDGSDWKECRRMLSRAYFSLMHLRLNRNSLSQTKNAVFRTLDYLRRLSIAIELELFNQNEAGNSEGARAMAFIAAEALSLWCDLNEEVLAQESSKEVPENFYVRVESALLYMASDYPVNGRSSINSYRRGTPVLSRAGVPEEYLWILESVEQNILRLLIFDHPNGAVFRELEFDEEAVSIHLKARLAALQRLGQIIARYLHQPITDYNACDELSTLISVLQDRESVTGPYADVLHLCQLLRLVLKANKGRILSDAYNLVPRTHQEWYQRYLMSRSRQRPLLWPAVEEYIKNAFPKELQEWEPGPHCDAVVAIPTGSGKSFIAELACSQALLTGWALYLAPTNALVSQVQGDLRTAFSMDRSVRVSSLLGGYEYDPISGDNHSSIYRTGSVLVMTPEKFSMLLRVNPDAFTACRLCVIDEFHLINDEKRGTLLDLSLARLLAEAPWTRLLFMSAMVANPDDIIRWIERVRRQNKEYPLVKWCRFARSTQYKSELSARIEYLQSQPIVLIRGSPS